MKRRWRITILFLGCLVYLILGSIIFSAIEGSQEDATRTTLNNSIMMFLDRHPTVPFDELVELLHCIKKASDQGVSPDAILSMNNASTEWQRIEKPTRKNWDLANSFFFSATIVTTIGYGHLAPSTKLGRNICVLYAFIGIPFFGWLLAEVTFLCHNKGRNLGKKIHDHVFHCIKGAKIRRVLTGAVMFASFYSIIILLPALSYSYIEGWDFPTAHYYCFITLSTIGFGDFVATDNFTDINSWRWLYKITTVLYFVVGLASLAVVLNSIQQRQQRHVRKLKAAVGRRISTTANANGNGELQESVVNGMGSEEVDSIDDDEEEDEEGDENENRVMMTNEMVKESSV